MPLAHQGLVGPDAPGNSLEAFDKAARSGYGIELDVRLCKDGLVMLHDRTVDCAGGVRRVRDMTRAELLAALPKGCAPELGPALMLIAGRVPVAVELKSDGLRGAGKLARAAAQALGNYAGPRCVLSFDPRALRAFGKLLPDVPRGQLVAGRADMRRWCGRALGWLLGNLLLNCVSRPALAAGPGGCAQPRHSRVAEAGRGMRRVDAHDPGTGAPCACAGRYRDIRRRGSAGGCRARVCRQMGRIAALDRIARVSRVLRLNRIVRLSRVLRLNRIVRQSWIVRQSRVLRLSWIVWQSRALRQSWIVRQSRVLRLSWIVWQSRALRQSWIVWQSRVLRLS